MNKNTENGVLRGGIAGVVTFILGLLIIVFWPPFSFEFVIGLSLGSFVGNFLIEYVKK